MTTPPPMPPGKKPMPPLAWLGIGCGTFLIIGVVLLFFLVGWLKRTVDQFTGNPEKTAAEWIVKTHPDLEAVRSDDATGELTFRTKDGKETTLSYKDISEGRLTVTDSEGNVARLGAADLSQVPEWVPRLPEMSGETSAFHIEEQGKITGAYAAKTSQTADEIEEFLNAEADRLGLSNSSRSRTSVNNRENRMLSYSDSKRKLTANLATTPDEPVAAHIGYEETP